MTAAAAALAFLAGAAAVKPAEAAFVGVAAYATAWVSAIRREQTATRATSFKIEWDAKFELVKLNPLADWTSDDVWTYIRSRGVPYNPLHDRNYPSIGCTHCTRAVQPGEHPRAGRWAGLGKTECGLHTRPSIAGGDAVTQAAG